MTGFLNVYWAVVTLTTVGYGDITLTYNSSKWFAIFYLPFSLVFMSLYLGCVAQVYVAFHQRNILRLMGARRGEREEGRGRRERSGRQEGLLLRRERASDGVVGGRPPEPPLRPADWVWLACAHSHHRS